MKNKTEVTNQDYKGSALEKSLNLTVEQTLEDNLEKGLIDQELFDKSMIELDILKAGKKAVLGEIRERKGGRYKKTVDGWEKVTEGNKQSGDDNVDHEKIAGDLIYEMGGHKEVGSSHITKEVEEYEIHGKNSALDSIIKKLGLKDSDKSKIATFIKDNAKKKEEKDKTNKIIELYKKGRSQSEISDDLNVDFNTVLRITNHLGHVVGKNDDVDDRIGDDSNSKQYHDKVIHPDNLEKKLDFKIGDQLKPSNKFDNHTKSYSEKENNQVHKKSTREEVSKLYNIIKKGPFKVIGDSHKNFLKVKFDGDEKVSDRWKEIFDEEYQTELTKDYFTK